MPTNAIGLGTKTVGVNFLVEERTALSRIAFDRNLTLSEFLRQTIHVGLEQSHPKEATALKALRERRRAQRLKITIRVSRPTAMEVA
jgi:hypothetical protein